MSDDAPSAGSGGLGPEDRRLVTSRALQLGRRLAPGAIFLAVVLAAPLAIAGQWVAALIFGIAPLAWLGWVTTYVYRVEKRHRA